MGDKESFFYPQARYQGGVRPQDLVFDANLQEFAQRAGLICALETGGKISPTEAYREIKKLWKQLKTSKKELLDNPAFEERPDLGEDGSET